MYTYNLQWLERHALRNLEKLGIDPLIERLDLAVSVRDFGDMRALVWAYESTVFAVRALARGQVRDFARAASQVVSYLGECRGKEFEDTHFRECARPAMVEILADLAEGRDLCVMSARHAWKRWEENGATYRQSVPISDVATMAGPAVDMRA
jgi:hypothetical protein